MSSNFIKILAAIFVVLAVIVGIIAYKKGTELAENSQTVAQPAQAQANAVPLTEVVIATKTLAANQPIDPASVKVIGLEVAPEHYYTKVDDVAGLIPLVDVEAGTPLTPRLIKDNPVARQIPDGMKAVSLTLTDIIGVGGFVRPGDIVDVLVFLHNDQPNKVEEAQARILEKDALVLAFDDHVINPPATTDKNPNGQQQQQQQQQRHERTVVVAVPDAEVSRVMLGASLGEVRLALHPQGKDQAPQAQVAAATPPAAATPSTAATPAAAAPAASAALPTPVSGGSMAATSAVATAPGLAARPGEPILPDQPYSSSELARLKKHPVGHGAPQGIIIYRGTKASTVYP